MATTLPVLQTATEPTCFHLSLNVDDIERSVRFFELLFDQPPSKHHDDYAKFELEDPRLVLSLEPNRAPRAGKLNHLGFRLASSEVLVAMQRRLEMAGLPTQREDGVECCYARQSKFWITDPDGNLWEMYTLEEDIEHRGILPSPAVEESDEPRTAAPAVWAHRLGEPVPGQIFAETASVDEVVLQGTFNGTIDDASAGRLLAEVSRVLRPGGTLTLYQLSARTPIARLGECLPGPAAAVEVVPSAQQLVDRLAALSLVDIVFEKLGSEACFVADGVECRETRLVGRKPPSTTAATTETWEVLYKGPFRQIEDDCRHTFRRGVWTPLSAERARQLLASPAAEQFVVRSNQ